MITVEGATVSDLVPVLEQYPPSCGVPLKIKLGGEKSLSVQDLKDLVSLIQNRTDLLEAIILSGLALWSCAFS